MFTFGFITALTKLSDLYGRKQVSAKAFIEMTQEILSVLRGMENSMPGEYAVDFAKAIVVPSRTSATLHLMLYQVRKNDPSSQLIGPSTCFCGIKQ